MKLKLSGTPAKIADDSQWLSERLWKVHQAVCLCVGIEALSIDGLPPATMEEWIADETTRVNWGKMYKATKDAFDLEELTYIKARTDGNPFMYRQVRPAEYVEWALGRGFELPPCVAALAKPKTTVAETLTLVENAHKYATEIYSTAKQAGATLTRTDICARVAKTLVADGARRSRGSEPIDGEYVRRRLLGDPANKWTPPKGK